LKHGQRFVTSGSLPSPAQNGVPASTAPEGTSALVTSEAPFLNMPIVMLPVVGAASATKRKL
jgi:hypothetical protein